VNIKKILFVTSVTFTECMSQEALQSSVKGRRKMALYVSEKDLYQAANYYTELGIIVHPLFRGDDKRRKCRSPGKQPILKGWQNMNKPLNDTQLRRYFLDNKYNIGAVCGKVSDLTVLDVDWEVPGIWEDIYQGVDRAGWIGQQRKEGKYHNFFRYNHAIKQAIKE
jgi:putative DNA primase/helicase